MLEDIGQVGTEGRVEILPRTSREQTEDIEFVTPVAKETQTEPRRVRQSNTQTEPLKLTSRGQNTKMMMPDNPALRLVPPTTEIVERRQPITFNFAEYQPDEPAFRFDFSEGFEAEEERPIVKKPKERKNPFKPKLPLTDEQRLIKNAKARARYAALKANA